jgi:hypothetical protein
MEDLEAVQRLRELGVHDVEFILARTTAGGFSTERGRVAAKPGVVVSGAWLAAVWDLVAAIGPVIDAEVQRAAVPDGGDPATNCRETGSERELLADLRIVFYRSETFVSARVLSPKFTVVDAIAVA